MKNKNIKKFEAEIGFEIKYIIVKGIIINFVNFNLYNF
jgi:hypothetical protein